MDTMQATYALTPPAMDGFGGPHFIPDDDDPADTPVTWIGDQSSVPLPAEADQRPRLEEAGAELDQEIFAALVTP
jgi:hypothetical protein